MVLLAQAAALALRLQQRLLRGPRVLVLVVALALLRQISTAQTARPTLYGRRHRAALRRGRAAVEAAALAQGAVVVTAALTAAQAAVPLLVLVVIAAVRASSSSHTLRLVFR